MKSFKEIFPRSRIGASGGDRFAKRTRTEPEIEPVSEPQGGRQISEPALTYRQNGLNIGDSCPRGAIVWLYNRAPGIDEVATLENEGFLVSPERQEGIDPAWRSQDGWYDRELSWAIPVITYHEEFDLETLYRASRSARNRYPEEYEAVAGKHPDKFGWNRIADALT